MNRHRNPTAGGDKTKVINLLSDPPSGVGQPAYIHAGRCDKLGAPKWHLEAVKDGRSVTVVPVSIDAILKQQTAINIHKSMSDKQTYVSCGNVIEVM